LLGELNAKSGSVSIVSGKIGYVPQQAWVVNASLRDNILMGEDMDHDRYAEAIHVSGLEADLKYANPKPSAKGASRQSAPCFETYPNGFRV
jgi:ABC-type bacteriocin/lantibiotic exporter with double-glycine peptidase domain